MFFQPCRDDVLPPPRPEGLTFGDTLQIKTIVFMRDSRGNIGRVAVEARRDCSARQLITIRDLAPRFPERESRDG